MKEDHPHILTYETQSPDMAVSIKRCVTLPPGGKGLLKITIFRKSFPKFKDSLSVGEESILMTIPKSLRIFNVGRIGDAVISTRDTALASETCEELFTPHGPHIGQSLDGVEIFTINGKIKAQGTQFSLEDVEVCCATVDLEEVRSFRCAPSRGLQAVQSPKYERIEVPFRLSKRSAAIDISIKPSPTLEPRYHKPEEEIGLGAGAYLWDYLRRSKQAGFFIPLSGGIDSCATSVIVFNMCRMVIEAIQGGNTHVIADARRICGEPEASVWLPSSEQELCGRVCFLQA
ncbi:MAG: hypothetical protein Q9187_006635 [Circinaria calcarea]